MTGIANFENLEIVYDIRERRKMIYNGQSWHDKRFLYISVNNTLTQRYFGDDYVKKNVRRIYDSNTGEINKFKFWG